MPESEFGYCLRMSGIPCMDQITVKPSFTHFFKNQPADFFLGTGVLGVREKKASENELRQQIHALAYLCGDWITRVCESVVFGCRRYFIEHDHNLENHETIF